MIKAQAEPATSEVHVANLRKPSRIVQRKVRYGAGVASLEAMATKVSQAGRGLRLPPLHPRIFGGRRYVEGVIFKTTPCVWMEEGPTMTSRSVGSTP